MFTYVDIRLTYRVGVAGPKEGALDLLWHPLRSCLASVATSGKVRPYLML